MYFLKNKLKFNVLCFVFFFLKLLSPYLRGVVLTKWKKNNLSATSQQEVLQGIGTSEVCISGLPGASLVPNHPILKKH